MIKKISAEINNKSFEFNNREGKNIWSASVQAPEEEDEYSVNISAEDTAGNIALKSKNLSVIFPEKLIYYLPDYWHEVLEMRCICRSEDIEVNLLASLAGYIKNEQFILTSSEERIKKWEKLLKINSKGTLNERKRIILSTLQSSLKINEKNLKTIIKNLNGKGGLIKFENSNLIIEAFSDTDKDFINTVESIVKPRLPAHIGLNIKKYWCVWDDLKDDFKSWNNINDNFKNWEEVKNYLPPKLI